MFKKMFKWVVGALGILTIYSTISYASITTITSLPDSHVGSGTDYSDTLVLSGTNLSSTENGLMITGHDVVLYLVDDTLTFGTDNGDGYYGVRIGANAYNIRVVGGMIFHGGTGDQNDCALLIRSNDILFYQVDMLVKGTNGHCFDVPSVGSPGMYNVEIHGGHFWNNSTAYTSRCQYDGAAFRLGQSYGGYGDYDYKVHGIKIVNTSGPGIMISGRTQTGNEALAYVYECTLTGDARNDFYSYPSGTCLSSANSYAIALLKLKGNSECHDNVVTSNTSYGGSRGILIENSSGNADSTIKIYNNYVNVHEGPNAEYGEGLPVHGLRVRAIDGGTTSFINVYNNTFICEGDTTQSTTSYNSSVMPMRYSQTNTPAHIIIENNLFRSKSLTAGVSSAAVVYDAVTVTDTTCRFRYNRIEGDGTLVHYGHTNAEAKDIVMLGDTLKFLSPTYSTETFHVGYLSNDFDCSGQFVIDATYESGVSDTNIIFAINGTLDITLQEILKIRVLDADSSVIDNANVIAVNNYGDTVITNTTDVDGFYSEVVSYWFEANWTSDSTAFNDFYIKAEKDGDTASTTLSVSPTSDSVVLVIEGIGGEGPPDAVTDLNAVPGSVGGTIELTWTSPDNNIEYYIIKYDTILITTDNWADANTSPDPPEPLGSGNEQEHTVINLDKGLQYYTAIRAYDSDSTASDLSNVPQSYSSGIRAPTVMVTTVIGSTIPESLYTCLIDRDTLTPEYNTIQAICDTVDSYLAERVLTGCIIHTDTISLLSYEFDLDTSALFSSPLHIHKLGVQRDSIASAKFYDLLYDVTYYWRCRAVSADASVYGEWSDTSQVILIE